MAGVEKRHKKRVLAERKGIGDGVSGRASGFHGILLRGVGE